VLKSADGALRAVPFPVDDPERIPAQRYYDAEFYQAELDHVWPHTWQMATRLERIPEVGDWVEYQNVGQSVIIVRTESGVKAFFNACRHRGVPFAGGKGNDHGNCKAAGFVCPFHGWRFSMDGQNTHVYGKHLFSEHQMNPDDINLIPCRVETAIGSAWINFDDDAPSLRDSIGPLLDRLEAHNMADLRAEWWFATELPANWKIAMEAFMEGYHVRTTHPQLGAADAGLFSDMYGDPVATAGAAQDKKKKFAKPGTTAAMAIASSIHHMELLSEGMAGMVHAKEVAIMKGVSLDGLPDDPALAVPAWYGRAAMAISEQLSARGEPVPDLMKVMQSDPINVVEFLFPHYFLLPMFTNFSAYRIRPLGPEKCLFELWSLTMAAPGEEPEVPMEPTMLPYDSPLFPPIPRQDYSNIPINQVGLHAKGFEFMRLSKQVEGMVSNYQRLIDGYIAGAPAEKLARANQKLGGNFDGVIEQFEF
jgi:carnitine monooxygenase subunit